MSLLALAQGAPIARLQGLIERFLDDEDAIAHAQPLMTGHDIMQQLNLSPGPQLGQLLNAIEHAQAEGMLATREDAMQWLAQQSAEDAAQL